MATSNGIPNGTHSPIHKVMILGDNRLASSIISGIKSTKFGIHQVTHSHSSELSNADITIHKSDFSPESLTSLFTTTSPDIIVSTQSGGSYEFQLELINTAIDAQVPRFVTADFGHDTLNPQIQNRLPPYKEKAKIIHHLQQQKTQSQIEWLGVACGCQPLDHALLSGNLGFDLKWQSATLPGSGTERFAASSSAWVGRLAHAIITHWDDVKNQYIYAAGMLTTGNAVVDCLQRQTDREWEVGNVDVGDLVNEAERRFERGFPDAGMFLMERSVVFDDAGVDAVRPFVERDAKGVLGLGEGEVLDDVVKLVVHEHEHHGGGADCGCE